MLSRFTPLSLLPFALLSACSAQLSSREGPTIVEAPRVAHRLQTTQPDSGPPLDGPVTRQALVEAAVARDPELSVMAHRVRARVAEARSKEALPPPMAMAQLWQAPLHAPFVYGDGSMLMLGVQQSFTPASARDEDARASLEEARAMALQIAVKERETALMIEQAFIEYAEESEMKATTLRHREMLVQMAGLVRARASTGGAGLAEVAKIEREMAMFDAEVVRAEAAIDAAKVEINGLLRRPAAASLGPPAPGDIETTATTLEQALSSAREHRTEIEASRASERAALAKGASASAMASKPMYTVGVNYGLMRQSGMSDTWGATFSMTLPWLSPGSAAMADAASAEAQAARAEASSWQSQIERDVSVAHAKVLGAERRLKVIARRLLPSTSRAVDAARTAYVGGPGDALMWLEAEHERMGAEELRVRARFALSRALASLDASAGAPLSRKQIDEGEVTP